MKYGLFKYSTRNIGDEVQSLAAKRFLPKVDYYFERDEIDATDIGAGERVKIIMNGWFTHKPENWPPTNNNIIPLLVSMHIDQQEGEDIKTIMRAFESTQSKEYLNKFGPVGARDLPTLRFLEQIGIESYFSGCMTLTLLPEKSIKRGEFVLAIDVSDDIYNAMKERTNRKIIRMNTNRDRCLSEEIKETIAKYWLCLLQSAYAVVTPRLHCMLPCLALSTPVLAISGRDPKRYEGLIELTNHVTEKEFLKNKTCFDFENPSKNPSKYLKLKKNLEEKCSAFTEFDSKKSFLGDMNYADFIESAEFKTMVTTLVEESLDCDVLRYKYNQSKNPGIKDTVKLFTKAAKRKFTH